MSGSLFCIILDPFLRLVLSRFSYSQLWPTTTFSAYLDELAFVLSRLFPQLALLLDMFDNLSEGAGPHLNFAKCVIIPLWTSDIEAARDRIRRIIPRAADFGRIGCQTAWCDDWTARAHGCV